MITVTKNAETKIKDLLTKESKQKTNLRIQLLPGGCSGFLYNLTFDDRKHKNDITIHHNGVTLIMDKAVIPYIKGSTLDYVDTLNEAGFKIENPNTHGSCHCGKSFCG